MLVDFEKSLNLDKIHEISVRNEMKLCIGAGDTSNFDQVMSKFDVFICCPKYMPKEHFQTMLQNVAAIQGTSKIICVVDLNDATQMEKFCNIFLNFFSVVHVDRSGEPIKICDILKILKINGVYIPPHMTGGFIVDSNHLLNILQGMSMGSSSLSSIVRQHIFYFDGHCQLHQGVRFDCSLRLKEIYIALVSFLNDLEEMCDFKFESNYKEVIDSLYNMKNLDQMYEVCDNLTPEQLTHINQLLFNACNICLANFKFGKELSYVTTNINLSTRMEVHGIFTNVFHTKVCDFFESYDV